MTENEKLDLILSEMQELKRRVLKEGAESTE